MYKYKKLQTLINYIVTKHGNTPQGASKITSSPSSYKKLPKELVPAGGAPERLSPYKKPEVVIPKAMYKLHSRKREPREAQLYRATQGVPEKRAQRLSTTAAIAHRLSPTPQPETSAQLRPPPIPRPRRGPAALLAAPVRRAGRGAAWPGAFPPPRGSA